ncbi:FtsH protease activity modulator HflK [Allofrancisella guangzhouensis]|uniref:Protein HflK n=1 Tax=Allofrancisella guangzhouensis TaxID=594679 RepID=A0A0A8E3L2_9GAMM|nr:FtsH protease activity modulator HflK [Allofrancisella guangzhouensis]AJC48820.1 membrane protein [Allofrancisella guangzhouensis]MBK2027283.1 FtsH protease activity modulator HflK [Allofrancisella guangzhouensis]MBK2044737.1 FtsH protease activity modulator HflK [Allofrancisella guangzhouensis]MBK2045921.1 FtsH protease activity modulator HflK [Allofrancisella guangzhouensis]
MIKKIKQRWFWNKNSDQGPPDLEEMIKKFFFKKKKDNGDDNESIYSKNANKNQNFQTPPLGKIAAIVIGLLIAIWVGFGFYVVQPAEQAAVLRFGKFSKIVESGLHWYPMGVDKVYKENVQELKTISLQRDMLTSEENIVHISFTVQYRISSLEDYLFANTDPFQLLQQSLESAVRQVVGQSNLSDILTTKRAAIAIRVKDEMEALLRQYKSGIYVSDIIMQPAQAPEAVKEAFDDVIKAREDQARLQNEAESYANRIIPVAEGRAQRIVDQANAYKQQVVLEAQAEVAQFEQLLPIYKTSPDIVTNQMYFDTISKVLQNNKIFLIDGDGAKNIFYGLNEAQRNVLASSNTQGSN